MRDIINVPGEKGTILIQENSQVSVTFEIISKFPIVYVLRLLWDCKNCKYSRLGLPLYANIQNCMKPI